MEEEKKEKDTKKDEIFIKPTADIVVKYLLGAKGTEKALLSFINAVLEDSQYRRIQRVTIQNPFNLKNFLSDKESVLDILAENIEGKQFNIEVQSGGNDVFINRSLYYWSRLYSGQLKEGEQYEVLKPTVCINLLDFELFKETKRIHNCFVLREKTEGYLLSEHIVLHFLELPKLRKLSATGKLDEWMLYFKCEGQEDEEKIKLMSRIMKSNKDIQETHDRYNSFKSDEEKKMLYEARMKLLKDYNQGLSTGYRQGKEEGELLKRQEILIRQLKKKFDISEEDEQIILSVSNPEKLDNALDDIISAESFKEILAGLRL